MARYITDHVHQRNAILTDDSQTLEVMLLRGRPDLFLDRIDHGDMAWRRVLDNPFGRVRYFLLPKWAPGHITCRPRRTTRSSSGTTICCTVIRGHTSPMRTTVMYCSRSTAARRPAPASGSPRTVGSRHDRDASGQRDRAGARTDRRRSPVPRAAGRFGEHVEVLFVPDDKVDDLPAGVECVVSGTVLPGEKRQLALERSRGTLIALIDDDAYPHPGWLAEVAAALRPMRGSARWRADDHPERCA